MATNHVPQMQVLFASEQRALLADPRVAGREPPLGRGINLEIAVDDVAPILAAGQEVQLHLHSFWRRLADGLGARRRADASAVHYGAARPGRSRPAGSG